MLGKRTLGVIAVAVALAGGTASGQPADAPAPTFPGYQGEPVYERTQALFDGHLRQGRPAEAYRVAMAGLVWRGDKHAQYMIGYMHHTGEGATRDPARACAWFRLAAERRQPRLEAARDAACGALDPADAERAAAQFAALRDEYGDRTVLRRLIQRDERRIRSSLTRHASLRDGNLMTFMGVKAFGRSIGEHGFTWHDELQRRMELRLTYLEGEGHVELGELTLIEDDEGERDSRDAP